MRDGSDSAQKREWGWEWGGGPPKVYTHVNKCKSDKIKERKKMLRTFYP
jgi:hypothetical protein